MLLPTERTDGGVLFIILITLFPFLSYPGMPVYKTLFTLFYVLSCLFMMSFVNVAFHFNFVTFSENIQFQNIHDFRCWIPGNRQLWHSFDAEA